MIIFVNALPRRAGEKKRGKDVRKDLHVGCKHNQLLPSSTRLLSECFTNLRPSNVPISEALLASAMESMNSSSSPVKFPILCGVFCVFGRAHLAILELLGVLKMWVRAVCARLDGNVVVGVVEALTY